MSMRQILLTLMGFLTGLMMSATGRVQAQEKSPAAPQAALQANKKAMTNEEAKHFLQQMFDMFSDPNTPIEKVTAFFSPDYVQDVDGKVLSYADFVKHLEVVRSTVDKTVITLQAIATNGTTVADIHIVDTQKKNGEAIQMKVLAFYTIENDKIIRLEELTHLLKGSAEDHDLGSRVVP